jgi:hypothetical protein
MLVVLVALTSWLSPTVESNIVGDIAFYSEGLMGDVVDNRGMNLEGYADGVALMSCGDLGREVWLELPQVPLVGPLLVADCSQEAHYEMNVERGRVADLSWSLWEELDLPMDLVSATIWFEKPRVTRHQRR